AIRSRQLNALGPTNWNHIPRAVRQAYAEAWHAEEHRLRGLERAKVQARLRAGMTGPAELRDVLGDPYGGPSVSIADGKWVLYTWTDAPSGEEVLCRHEDWDEFLRLVGEYAGRRK